jgi:methyltransferase (TIGR00027 family)
MNGVAGEPSSSRTAVAVAWLRARHLEMDPAPPILRDEISGPLVRAVVKREGFDLLEKLDLDGFWRSAVVVRSRFAEDRLRAAVEQRGVAQCVVLGAGFDTFAYRQPEWALAGLCVYEVDRPESQHTKRAALEAAGVAVPQNVRYVAVNFERDDLGACLTAAGVALDQPCFFSWLGVMTYLTTEASDAVFRFVAARPPGSEIVLTFSPLGSDRSELVQRSARAVAEAGEPWINFIAPEELCAKLSGFGFTDVFLLTPEIAQRLYFANRVDLGLPPPHHTRIAAAIR